MFAAALASTPHAVASSHGYHDYHGEAVLVTPAQAAALDDRVFATRASFAWRARSVVVTQPGGQRLRYSTNRPVAIFAANSLPRGLQPGERVTRSWDGAVFDILAVGREGGTFCCDLVERDRSIH